MNNILLFPLIFFGVCGIGIIFLILLWLEKVIIPKLRKKR
jgi:hypothetical protein